LPFYSSNLNNVLLAIKNLKIYYHQGKTVVRAVDGVDLEVKRGDIVAIIGESGSGKTTLAHSILRLLPSNAEIISGSILFKGQDLLKIGEKEIEKIRGREISMIFQEPQSHLNPVMTVKDHLLEALKILRGLERDEAYREALTLLKMVRIPDPERVMNYYPHQLSGGMAQRVLIALSIAGRPSLLIADEPTSALDPTIQVQILRLLKELNRTLGISILLITHDLGVVAALANYIYIMYAGKLCEHGATSEILTNPRHPYTQALLASIPNIKRNNSSRILRLSSTELITPAVGCKFYPRCPYAMEICKREEPIARSVGGSTVYCFLY